MPLHWVCQYSFHNYYLLHAHYILYTTYAHNSSSVQFDHLEWLLNGTVYKPGMVGSMSLQLLIQSVTFAHAGSWECRAVLSDGTTSLSVGAGVLTVFSEFHTIHNTRGIIASNISL